MKTLDKKYNKSEMLGDSVKVINNIEWAIKGEEEEGVTEALRIIISGIIQQIKEEQRPSLIYYKWVIAIFELTYGKLQI